MMKTKILKILRNSDKHVSGQQICNILGVSRTAVWKVISQLKEEGYEIESISSKGYRMISFPDLVTKEEVSSQMCTEKIARKVCYYDEIDSTNSEAKRLAEQEESDGLLVISEVQSAGKGRRGKSWSSPKGTGIWMSLILKPNIKPENASMLTLVSALAVTNVIRKRLEIESYIKWPNDIVVNGRKVCGILTEMSSEVDYINHIVIGIGINANGELFPEDIKDTATSLFLAGGKKICRSELIASIMKEFEEYYQIFLETENLSKLMQKYNELLINNNRTVRLFEQKKETIGTALGINEMGELLIETEGKVRNIMSGEVSVRGIYGYV